MKQLEKTIKRGLFTYNQLARNANVAIYEQRDSELGIIEGHEVFFINKYEEREIMGNVIPAHEAMPGDNQFGISAWSVGRDPVRAMEMYHKYVSEFEIRHSNTLV